MELIVLQGIPASGKSTWARVWQQEDPENRVIVNRDSIRVGLGFEFGNRKQEGLVSVIEETSIKTALENGMSVCIDATNLNTTTMTKWGNLAHQFNLSPVFKMFDVDIPTALRRDADRDRQVGRTVIENFYFRYIREDRTFIFDLDNTLCEKCSNRGPYEFEKAGSDTETPLAVVARGLSKIRPITILTGRERRSEDVCRKWLSDHEIVVDQIIMRKNGDRRTATIVKPELLVQYLDKNPKPICIFDDDLDVCKIYEGMGVNTITPDYVKQSDYSCAIKE